MKLKPLPSIRGLIRAGLFQIRHRGGLGPYHSISKADRQIFNEVLQTWKPTPEAEVTMLRWFISEWCNYNCPYCPQNHGRYRKIKGGFSAHAFDNFPVEKWLTAFEKHFRNRAFTITLTGGEPMLDRVAMPKLLEHLCRMETCRGIRIDTNGSWPLKPFEGLPKEKIELMCTFHPSHAKLGPFVAKIQSYLEAGFKIAIVNFVMSGENFDGFQDIRSALAQIGVPVNPNPLWGGASQYSKGQIDQLKNLLPAEDFEFRSGIARTRGRKCLFPALAYELNQSGYIQVGCHRGAAGNFFEDTLPALFSGPVPCPFSSCICVDKYSFLEEVNRNTTLSPIGIYGELLKQRSISQNDSAPQ